MLIVIKVQDKFYYNTVSNYYLIKNVRLIKNTLL
jgi:hypothetical protein